LRTNVYLHGIAASHWVAISTLATLAFPGAWWFPETPADRSTTSPTSGPEPADAAYSTVVAAPSTTCLNVWLAVKRITRLAAEYRKNTATFHASSHQRLPVSRPCPPWQFPSAARPHQRRGSAGGGLAGGPAYPPAQRAGLQAPQAGGRQPWSSMVRCGWRTMAAPRRCSPGRPRPGTLWMGIAAVRCVSSMITS